MKALAVIFLISCLYTATRGQGTLDSLSEKVMSATEKYDPDSLQEQLPQLPDSLLPAYSKIDSIRIAFNQEADSLETQYKQEISKIDRRANKLNNRIDSLSNLQLPSTKYTKSLDSLGRVRQKLEEKFTSRLSELKTKTTGKLNSLDLPPEYQKPVQALTSKIDRFNLDTPGVDIPELRVPGFSVPKIGDLTSKTTDIGDIGNAGNIPGIKTPTGNVSDITGQAKEYEEDIKNITSGNLKDIQKLPETIEQQAAKIDGMEELQKQSGIIDADKAKLAELNDPKKAKEKAVALAKKTAVNHFAGKEEQLKAAMDKIAKYKQKYSSVSSIKDLPKRPPNPMKGKPFVERLVPGLFLQYQRKDLYLVDFNPYVGYKISGRFVSGLGWNHRYAYDKKTKQFNSRSVIFGPRAYVDCKLGKGFIAHVEGESMNAFVPSTLIGNPDTGAREWVWSFMTGIKKEYRIYKNLKGTALIQYNLFNRHYKAPYVDRLNSRIGFEYVLKKAKKANRRP